MAEARVFRSITQHRADLDAQERGAMLVMTRAYQETLDRLVGTVAKLEAELEAMDARGETPTIGRIFRTQQTRTLLLQAQMYFNRFGATLGKQLAAEVEEAARKAMGHAQSLTIEAMGTPPEGVAVDALFTKLPDQAVANIVALTTDGPVADILNNFGDLAASEARRALMTGVAIGEHPNLIAKRLKDALGVPFHRAATIARTEVLRGYREASRRWYEANSRTVKAWLWHSALDRRTCAACWAMHGQEFPLDTPMGTHPACRCAMVPKTKTWKELGFPVPEGLETTATTPSGSEIFKLLPAADQRAILGKRAYNLYRDGKIGLKDLVHTSHTDDWGTTRRRASIADALRNAAPAPPPAPPPAKRDVARLSIDELADLDELERWGAAHYPGTTFDFKGAHIDTIKPTLKQYDALAKQYPEVANNLKYVGTYQGPNSPKRPTHFRDLANGDEGAYAHAYGTRDIIGLNHEWYGNPTKYLDSLYMGGLKNRQGISWHPEGANSVESVLTHEFGHQVHNWLLSVPGTKAFRRTVDIDGTGLIQDTFRRFFYGNRATPKLSGYAITNEKESFAEAFTALYHTPKGSPTLKLAYVKRAKRALELLGDPGGWLDQDEWQWRGDLPTMDERRAAYAELEQIRKDLGIK